MAVMNLRGQHPGILLLLALLAAPGPWVEGAESFGLGVGLLAGDGGSHAPWSFQSGTRDMYGTGGAVELSWLFRPERGFQIRPRLTFMSLGAKDTITDGYARVQAKAHGRSLTCDLLWRFNPASVKPFYLFIGPGLGAYAIGTQPSVTSTGSGGYQFDVGAGMILSRGLEVELRYCNHAGISFGAGASYGAASMGYPGPVNSVTAADYSPNALGLVLRKRF